MALAVAGAGAVLGDRFLAADPSTGTGDPATAADRNADDRAGRAAGFPPTTGATPTGSPTPSAAVTASPPAPPSPPATTRPRTPGPTRSLSPVERMENEVTALVNQERAKAGCAAVHTDERLRTAARAHSADMATYGYFSHTGRDGSSPWDRAGRAGYTQAIGENIAYGYASAAEVVRGWMNSAGHRANILNCSARAVGNGLAYSRDGTPYWTQLFGSV